MATHHFALDDVEKAYDTYAAAADMQGLKVVLTAASTGRELLSKRKRLATRALQDSETAAVELRGSTTQQGITHTYSEPLVEEAAIRRAHGETVSWVNQLDAAFDAFRRNKNVDGMQELLQELTDERITYLMRPDRIRAMNLKSTIAMAIGSTRAFAAQQSTCSPKRSPRSSPILLRR